MFEHFGSRTAYFKADLIFSGQIRNVTTSKLIVVCKIKEFQPKFLRRRLNPFPTTKFIRYPYMFLRLPKKK